MKHKGLLREMFFQDVQKYSLACLPGSNRTWNPPGS
jgi:hypothetical protein